MQTPQPRTNSQYRKWLIAFYLPHLLLSPVRVRHPRISAFNSAPNSPLIDVLEKINVARPTALCRVMTQHGSDKGRRWHNYTTIYAALFAGKWTDALRIFELGLGTNNPSLVSSMGSTGRPGASLRGWRQLFPQARIYGADIDRDILFDEDGIKTFYCDQLDAGAIRALWDEAELKAGMDILIEDGLHTLAANISFLEGSLSHVTAGGTYVIEDIETATLPAWRDLLPDYAGRFPGYEFALLELPNPANAQGNNMLVIRRHS